jgi:2'-5' RNA ligase
MGNQDRQATKDENGSASNRDGRMRLFIATPVSAEIRASLSAAVARVRARLSRNPIRWVSPDNLHLTFRFLGETPGTDVDPITKRLRGVCGNFSPLDVQVGGLGCFPNFAEPRVIWVGLSHNSQLVKLHTAIQNATAEFGAKEASAHTTERTPPFSPHLTVGRLKDVSRPERRRVGRELEQQTMDKLGCWLIDRVVLMESQLTPAGPCYEELMSIALAARA